MPLRDRAIATVAVASLLLVGAPEASAQFTVRVSRSALGVQGDEAASDPAVSADGRFVAFSSAATSLVPGVDDPLFSDVFLVDRETGAIELVSGDPLGEEGDGHSLNPAVSADGRFVAFQSMATNLVPGDVASVPEIYLFDRSSAQVTSVSTGIIGDEPNGFSLTPSISPDGRYVAFQSGASNLVAADTNGFNDIFVYDRLTGSITLASLDSAGQQGNGDCSPSPAVSADGRHVAFRSNASNLVPDDTNAAADVFVRDLVAGTTERASVSTSGTQGNGISAALALSSDGNCVAFVSLATNLVSNDTNAASDVFVRDRTAGETTRVSVGPGGIESNGPSQFSFGFVEPPSISADGRYVAFFSAATNLTTAADTPSADVFVHDRLLGVTIRASQSTLDQPGDDASTELSLAGQSPVVAFGSLATNLVSGDTNIEKDIFARDFTPCRAGGVNLESGTPAPVLTVNGASGIVGVARRAPVEFALAASPAGPDPARYALFVWGGALPERTFDLAAKGLDFGCTFLPTPLQRPARPQPIRCLLGTGMPSLVCRGVREAAAPERAPWAVGRNRGFGQPIRLVLQAILEDDGSTTGSRFSLTNAIVLQVF